MLLKGKTTLITGASSGIGEATARLFASEGSDLILIARRADRLETVRDELITQYDIKIHIAGCDVRDYHQVESFILSLPEEFREINILINNAGLASGLSKFYEGDLDDWEAMIDTNIKGLLYVSKLVAPQMVERNEGSIINIASIAGLQAYPNGNVSCATKAAVGMLSQGMVIDLNGTNVRVTNIDPGLLESEFALVRFHGDKDMAAKVYEGFKPLDGGDVAEVALFVATRPAHVLIQNILITPTAQATTTMVNKKLP
jgi:NADP-dependent 3-hydroxy acid dehydrogenase YdfG